jgi:hypothetical protein
VLHLPTTCLATCGLKLNTVTMPINYGHLAEHPYSVVPEQCYSSVMLMS